MNYFRKRNGIIMKNVFGIFLYVSFFTRIAYSQENTYPQNYFRHPLNIKMELVSNFGEIRTNHWHMGLDIRTQRVVNKPVFASAEGYISRVVVEPGGFGQAIYIDHPNGFTTLYAHMNSFYPSLAKYVKDQQYQLESWHVDLKIPAGKFPVKKGSQIGLSGNTGGSLGPHVHFEIRDTKTENCLNPLLFKFPIPDKTPPTITRLAMYDRNKSTYEQSPQLISIKRSNSIYSPASGLVKTGSRKISFAIASYDRFTGVNNPVGIYSAKLFMDGRIVSDFVHDDISYNDTRYLNAQLDYPYKKRGGADLQHISPLPGVPSVPYNVYNGDGMIHLNDDERHEISIEVRDANFNLSKINFSIQYEPELSKQHDGLSDERFLPGNVNIFEREDFELFTSERTIYDTITLSYKRSSGATSGAVSPIHTFLSPEIPSHDAFTVRIKPGVNTDTNRIIIKNVSGTRTYISKAEWQNGWAAANFRQFGTFQAFVDTEPPTINAIPTTLTKATRIVITPKDNFNSIKSFRAELDGQWLRFTNDKGRTWIYYFDEYFPRGDHELKIIVEDEAGNVMNRVFNVRR